LLKPEKRPRNKLKNPKPNFRLFRERDARGILSKKTKVVIPGALSLVLSLDEQRKNK
jgi:hypothetical protein